MDLGLIIRKYCLQNAILHQGKAQSGAITGKLLAEKPELKPEIGKIMKTIIKTVSEVNKLSLDEQKEELEKIAPELLEKKKIVEEKTLPPLLGAVQGKVVVRYPPEPGGYMHLGNAMSFFINRIYADMYSGTVWLRFEDTNPLKVKKKYYEAIEADLNLLGLKWDRKRIVSDDIPILYEHGEKALRKGNFYMCTCKPDEVKANRAKGKECSCRNRPIDENLRLWNKMLKDMPEAEAIVRLKGDMKSPNMDLRDPMMFRIIDAEHPMQKKKYRVWPSYDFAVAIEEHLCGITHVLRSQEFEQRSVLQSMIRKLFGYPDPVMIHYSRFGLEGAPTSKRKLRELLEKGVIDGWDDPRIPTIMGLRRKGILPDAIKELAVTVGPTKSSHTVEWPLLLSINKKILDPVAPRYFVVRDPIKLVVKNAPKKIAKVPIHPSNPENVREIPTSGTFYIEKLDVNNMKPGIEFRLKDLYNVKVSKITKGLVEGEFAGIELKEMAKIHWVPEENISVKLIVPDILFKGDKLNKDSLKEVDCLGEINLKKLKLGDQFQMERVGFGILDKLEPLTVIFTSK